MHPADAFTVDEAMDFFSKCLNEHGVDDVDITHSTEDFADVLYVRKRVGDEQIATKVSLNLNQRNLTDVAEIQKELALQAECVAKQLREQMVTTFEWDGRCVKVSPYDGGWAECQNCGTRVDFHRRGAVPFTEEAELSCPHPLPRDTERAVANLDGRDAILFKLYVLGQLREQCDFECRNHKHNIRDKEAPLLNQVAGD